MGGAVVQSVAEKRVTSLYRSAGFLASDPPNAVCLAQALLGHDSITFVGSEDRRGAAVRAISRRHIYLQTSASDEENAFAIIEAIARWDVERTGPGVNVRSLALAIALPYEVMTRFREDGLSNEQIADEYRLPLSVVRARQATFVSPTSVQRLRAAERYVPDIAADAG